MSKLLVSRYSKTTYFVISDETTKEFYQIVDTDVDIGNLFNDATDNGKEVDWNDEENTFKENNIEQAAKTSKIEKTLDGENQRTKENLVNVDENTNQLEMARREEDKTIKENKTKTERNTNESEKASCNVRTERSDENIIKLKGNTCKMEIGTKRNKETVINMEGETAKMEITSNVGSKTSPLLKCDACNFEAVTKAALAIHKTNHLSVSKLHVFTCADCSFHTKFRHSLIRHERVVHRRTVIFWCSQCSQSCFSKAELESHTCVGHKKLSCNMCNFETSVKQALIIHKKDRHGYVPRIFRCPDCVFQTECCKSIIRHQRTIHGHKDCCCCRQCGKTCVSRAELRAHECSSHERIVCHLCGKTFSSPNCLKLHINVHFGINLHQCNSCSKAYPRKFDLARHQDIMHKDKRTSFKCEQCSAIFLYKSSLYRHAKVSHCTERTETRRHGDLATTTLSKRGRKLICSHCNKLYTYEASLNRHLLVHSKKDEMIPKFMGKEYKKMMFQCTQCTRTYLSSHNLCRHVKQKHSG